jgi:hypothetical protein
MFIENKQLNVVEDKVELEKVLKFSVEDGKSQRR